MAERWYVIEEAPGRWRVTDGTTTQPEIWSKPVRAVFRCCKLNLAEHLPDDGVTERIGS